MTNFDLEKMVETSDEWIFSRTGIRERRILEEGLSNVDLSERASREALRNAGLEPEQVELILAVSYTHLDVYKRQTCRTRVGTRCR